MHGSSKMTLHRFFPILVAFCANFILGASSIYWHLFSEVSPVALVMYRILFSLLVLALFIVATARVTRLIRAATLRVVFLHVAAAVLVSVNWGTFIWASIHGSVLESGLGYLMAPVVVMSVGALLPGGSIRPEKIIAIGAIVTVLGMLVLSSGPLAHWVYWTIGLTWGGYTLLKKGTPLPPVDGLFVETTVLFAMIVLVSQVVDLGVNAMSQDTLDLHPALYLCGVVSVAPLIMFSSAAKRLDTYSMGALQFVLPTTQLLVSILYYQQYASIVTYLCFGTIWAALIFANFVDVERRRAVGT